MRRFALAVLVLLVLLAGCRRGGTPPQITAGTTTCDSCRKVIDDASLASAALGPDGKARAFDSAACLLGTVPESGEWRVWFRDKDSEKWIEASKAVFVIHREHAGSPVSYVAAFPDRKAASAFYERTPGRNEIAPDYSTLRGVLSHE